MITNERQYKITRHQLNKIDEAINALKNKIMKAGSKSEILTKAGFDALTSERENLANQILEYEKLKSGAVDIFRAATLEELPKILIEARIAKNFSQRKLAELIGVREQQIQRYEAQQYAIASFARLAQIAKALELNITEIAKFE